MKEIKNERSREAQGRRAGFVSQVIALVLDAAWILLEYIVVLAIFAVLRGAVHLRELPPAQTRHVGEHRRVVRDRCGHPRSGVVGGGAHAGHGHDRATRRRGRRHPPGVETRILAGRARARNPWPAGRDVVVQPDQPVALRQVVRLVGDLRVASGQFGRRHRAARAEPGVPRRPSLPSSRTRGRRADRGPGPRRASSRSRRR